MNDMKNKNTWLSVFVIAAALALVALVAPRFTAQRQNDRIKPGPGVSSIRMLSEYFGGIKGTNGDTEVYILDSGTPGATMFVMGSTHGNEPAGRFAALLIVERAVPSSGRLIVLPAANASALTHSDYMESSPRLLHFDTPTGPRNFRFGSRATSPRDQWPDPDIYVHAASGQALSGSETRNLNRAYPGRPDGSFTEKVAWAITSLIKAEKADITIDLHEASPEYPVVNAVVANEDALLLASEAVLSLEIQGISMGIEPSPEVLRGLSHRELGAATGTKALLFETANPSQGRIHGAIDEKLVLDGKDAKYLKAAQLGRLYVPYDESGLSLGLRVGRHLESIKAVAEAQSSGNPDRPLSFEGLPEYAELAEKGLGPWL